MDNSSLAHMKWNCKYHILFVPKYRRQVIYGKIKVDIGKILRKMCEHNGVEIIEANACKDLIHMLVNKTPKLSASQFMGYLKGKKSLMIFDRHANKKVIEEYLKKQIQEDIMHEQISLKEYMDPFKGESVGKK